jgi:hypothetical protein
MDWCEARTDSRCRGVPLIHGMQNFSLSSGHFHKSLREKIGNDSLKMRELCQRSHFLFSLENILKKELRGLSQRGNYTDRATASCRLN